MYFNINKILPYQRNFNFINGARSIGKTYTTLEYVIRKCIKNKVQFVYLVRTKDEKKKKALEKGTAKVLKNEFDELFEVTEEHLILKGLNGNRIIGYCLALSEYQSIKKESYPDVEFIVFDEYMREKMQQRYVNGYDEPDLLLSIYHTIDRDEDKVKFFGLGNNTMFYNPYHMHPAFNIPNIEKGEIWTSENVLFYNAVASDEFKEKVVNGNKFLAMIKGSSYGDYATEGVYSDNVNFIAKRSKNAKMAFILKTNKFYGVWIDNISGISYISDRYDKGIKYKFALVYDSHDSDTILCVNKMIHPYITNLSSKIKKGNVRFETMAIKVDIEKYITKIL